MTKGNFEIQKRKPAPYNEQETIIMYDKELDEWNLYTNNPTHARKWEQAIIPSNDYRNSKVYHSVTGDLIEIEGKINGSASIRKKKTYTPEQKEAFKKRVGVS